MWLGPMAMNLQEVRTGDGTGRGGDREGRELTSGLLLLSQNVTLAMAVFTILASIYFFNKVRGRQCRRVCVSCLCICPCSFSVPSCHTSPSTLLSLL